MAKMCAPLMLYIASAMFHLSKGLEVTPSNQPRLNKFYYSGSNLTLSCSEKDLMHMDWMKNSSVVSSCSIDQKPYCLPGGRYTYENESFNFMLTNMTSKDCTLYTCRTFTGSKSFSLHLIDRVKRIDVEENTHSLTMTTNCVYPANTVNVQWFYIHEDAAPALYHKIAKRSEERENCVETCWENKALKVSSTLELPTDVKNPIKVKMMMYVEHGGLIKKIISANVYTIEGCLPPTKDGIIVALCLAVILIIVDIICICLLKRRQHEQWNDQEDPISPAPSTNVHTDRLQGAEPTRKVQRQEREEHTKENKNAGKPDARCSNVDTGLPEGTEPTHTVHVQETEEQRHADVIVPLIVSGVILICCIILLVLKHETRIPDINGNCQDVYITNMKIVVAVTFVIILICIHWSVLWDIVTLIRGMRRKMMLRKSMMLRKAIEGNADEAKGLLGGTHSRPSTGHSTNIDTCELEVAELINKKENQKQKKEDMKSKEKKPEENELLEDNCNRPNTGHSTNYDTCELEVAEQINKKETHEQKEEGMNSKEKKPEGKPQPTLFKKAIEQLKKIIPHNTGYKFPSPK